MKHLLGRLALGVALLGTSCGYGLTPPEQAFSLVQEKVDAFVEREVDSLIPLSMHAHYTTGVQHILEQGKFSDGEFSDYNGDVRTTVRLVNNYYVVDCHVNVKVDIESLAMRDLSHEWILEEVPGGNGDQLIGKFHVSCKKVQ